ncbi:MAG: endonuclease MutS2 [Calditrichia bacterium]
METQRPTILNDDNLQQLELPTLLEKLRSLLSTPYGVEHLNRISILRDPEEVNRRLQEVSEAAEILGAGYSFPFSEVKDIRSLLERLQPEDAFLEPAEIREIKNNLEMFDALHKFILSRKENCPALVEYAHRIHSHKNLIAEIDRAIDERGEIRDSASTELRRIRIEIQKLENEQKTVLMRVLKRYSEFSQDDIVTLRDGRMVLGIQQHFASRVNGIVHGTSGTGATVFIEPMETLRISNQIQNLKLEERTEIIRILQFLSGLIREIRHDLLYTIENVGFLDFIHAKSRLSMMMNGTAPQITTQPHLQLIQARHPLLLLKMGHHNVVPCSLELGKDFYTLVITGPNAGGKTVALKTVGLMVVMAQMGLHIPAKADSVIPLMDRILVDIGDRQSLEQDLSTFSAHIIRLKEILRQAHTHTLVLVDEIGTGTDPREGAALAISILKELTERKSLTVATTHHGELKAFAFATPGVGNASMQFDTDSLLPTYQLQTGIPGSSYAFEIARRYGLPEGILKNAEQIVGPDKGQLEQLILDLNERLQKLEEERRRLSIRLSEVEGLRNLYQNELERLEKEKTELRKKAAEEARQIVETANARIEAVVADIRKTQAEKKKIREAHQTVSELRQSLEKILTESSPPESPPAEFHKGDIVWVDDLREEGEVLSEPNAHNKVWVLVNQVKLKVDGTRLRKMEKKELESRHVFRTHRDQLDRLSSGTPPELDLRGMDVIEAIEATDRYLDAVMKEGWEEIRIIHGKGTGTLRKKINQYLSGDKRVEEKRLGKWGEGDTGVTIVRLRK